MQYVNMHDAKTNFSKYIQDVVTKHEKVIVCRNGKPVAQITEFKEKPKIKPGLMKGKVKLAKDFDVLPKDFMKYFE